jgi:spore maturation protein CgeB
MFYQSLISDWNHGNAHFLRGIATDLIARGHEVVVYEPVDSWSVQNLIAKHGETAIDEFELTYPQLRSVRYDSRKLDLDHALDNADLVVVHEWNEPELIQRIGDYRERARYFRLLFHDTHHRLVNSPEPFPVDLSNYDGVLAYGQVIADAYLRHGWTEYAWTWHEAADTRVFHPLPGIERTNDLVWIGNWGDEERTAELREFLLEPVCHLRLDAAMFGVRYPHEAFAELDRCGIAYCGWLPNYRVPEVFAKYRVTLHVPRRPYVDLLRGIPTIRPFEAMACGIPLICSPWEDSEQLFHPGRDFLIAHNGKQMEQMLRDVLGDPALATELALNGLTTILERHTCSHRVDELLSIYRQLEAAEDSSLETAWAAD